MSSDFNHSGQDTGTGRSGFRVPPRTKILWILWLLIFGGIILLMLFRDRLDMQTQSLSEYDFLRKVDSNLIAHAVLRFNPQSSALTEITGTYYKTNKGAGDGEVVPFRTVARLTPSMEERLLSLPQFEPLETNTFVSNLLWSVLPILVIAVLIWFFFISRMKRIARASAASGELPGATNGQRNRMDGLLDKWEEQARRMDAILDRMEREKGDRA